MNPANDPSGYAAYPGAMYPHYPSNIPPNAIYPMAGPPQFYPYNMGQYPYPVTPSFVNSMPTNQTYSQPQGFAPPGGAHLAQMTSLINHQPPPINMFNPGNSFNPTNVHQANNKKFKPVNKNQTPVKQEPPQPVMQSTPPPPPKQPPAPAMPSIQSFPNPVQKVSHKSRLTNNNRKKGWEKYLNTEDRNLIEKMLTEADEFDEHFVSFEKEFKKMQDTTSGVNDVSLTEFNSKWCEWKDQMLHRREQMSKLLDETLDKFYKQIIQHFPLFLIQDEDSSTFEKSVPVKNMTEQPQKPLSVLRKDIDDLVSQAVSAKPSNVVPKLPDLQPVSAPPKPSSPVDELSPEMKARYRKILKSQENLDSSIKFALGNPEFSQTVNNLCFVRNEMKLVTFLTSKQVIQPKPQPEQATSVVNQPKGFQESIYKKVYNKPNPPATSHTSVDQPKPNPKTIASSDVPNSSSRTLTDTLVTLKNDKHEVIKNNNAVIVQKTIQNNQPIVGPSGGPEIRPNIKPDPSVTTNPNRTVRVVTPQYEGNNHVISIQVSTRNAKTESEKKKSETIVSSNPMVAKPPNPNIINIPLSKNRPLPKSPQKSANYRNNIRVPISSGSYEKPTGYPKPTGYREPVRQFETPHRAPNPQVICTDINSFLEQERQNLQKGKFSYTDSKYFTTPRQYSEEPLYIKELLEPPSRPYRPPRIVLIIRGLPGSGKSYLSKLIKTKEENMDPSSKLRLFSLDDYFFVEREQHCEQYSKLEMIYEYDASKESEYKFNLFKAYRKCLMSGFHNFVIVDSVNTYINDVREFYACAIEFNFIPYVIETEAIVRRLLNDCVNGEEVVAYCYKHNRHGRSLAEIRTLYDRWELLPVEYLRVNAFSVVDEDMQSSKQHQPSPPPQPAYLPTSIYDEDERHRPHSVTLIISYCKLISAFSNQTFKFVTF